MFKHTISLTALLWLVRLRWLAIVCQAGVILLVQQYWEQQLPIHLLLSLISCSILVNIFTHYRLTTKPALYEWEISLQLLWDISILTGLLALTGSASNPFTAVYLLPIALGAVVLSTPTACVLSFFCILCYSGLMLNNDHHAGHGDFGLHVTGMWVNFLITAVLMTGFLNIIAQQLRQRELALAKAREDQLRNQHVVATATLAAGAAHELGTPLNSATLLIEQLEAQEPQNQTFALLQQQMALCKQALHRLRNTSQPATMDISQADPWLAAVLQKGMLMHPNFLLKSQLKAMDAQVTVGQDLEQGLLNIIHNAVDASKLNGVDLIEIHSYADAQHYYISVYDQGPGMTPQQKLLAGADPFTTKTHGLGLGLMLSNATLERYGGILSLHSNPQPRDAKHSSTNQQTTHGLMTRVQLPLAPASS